jgi:hypothetical protein
MTHSDDPNDRYEEILRRIAARKHHPADASAHFELSTILDGLNALGFLDDLRRKRLPGISYYGPSTYRGTLSSPVSNKPRRWVGAIAWHKPRGYHHYRMLTLLGIWAVEAPEGTQIIVATKSVEFDAPVFNPESYYRNIKRDFHLYYPDDGRPPESGWLYTTTYNPADRLATRAALQSVLRAWAEAQTDPTA